MTKTMSWAAGEPARPLSTTLLYFAAAALQAASQGLSRVAEARASAVRAARRAPQVVEFHPIYRDAGAPEGAIYVDGVLVGTIEGVTRL